MDVGFNHNYFKQNQRFSDIVRELRGLLLPIKGYENMPLVSLEESVMPLVPILPDIHTYVFMAKDNSSKPPAEGLTLDESAAICLYSIEWEPHDECLSRSLNQTLRSTDRQKLNSWYLYLKLILTALAHLPSISNQIIYRGIKLDLSKDYPQGKKIIWWGFSSCTSSLSVLQSVKFIGKTGIRTMFVIECYSGKNISKHTYFQSEEEVLIPPATRFVVISCEDQSNGLHVIHLKEIPPPFTLLEPINIVNASLTIESNSSSIRKSVPMVYKVSDKKRRSIDSNLTYWNSKLEQLICENEFPSSLNLSQEQVIDQDIPIIIQQAIINKQCTILDLTGNEITSEGADLLADTLNKNSTLQELFLYNNRLGDKGVRSIAFELSINNSTLKKLHLGFNDITDDGAQHLAQMLKTNRTLTHLWLEQNHIGDRGIQFLAGILARHNWSLKCLSLFSNKLVSDSSVTALVDMLRLNQSLQKLDISDCNLTEIGEVKLQEIIKSKQDFQLII
jgi:hypothetical protein